MKELTNRHTQPITLESGVVLAAAGTGGSVRRVESLSDADQRRYADRGLIAVSDVEFEPQTVERRPSTVAEKPAAASKAEKETK